MRAPILVRALSDGEHAQLVAGMRSPDAFVVRRCQILLASAQGEIAQVVARNLGCDDKTVRTAIVAFNARGVNCLTPPSSRPHTIHAAFDATKAEQLASLPPREPAQFRQSHQSVDPPAGRRG